MGFLDVDSLIALCKSTSWTTYKIWQAVKAGDLHYRPVLYIRSDQKIKEALKLMIIKSTKFAVVKKGHREVGMIGESAIREALGSDKTTDLGNPSEISLSQFNAGAKSTPGSSPAR